MAEHAPAWPVLRTRAPAKVNLTLHVLGRRQDGYHELESLVAFAGVADHLELTPGEELSLTVEGPTAGMAGPTGDNLVLRAARALAERRLGLLVGAFRLTKRLPAAAGIGGGSSDAAAALRLLARANGLPLHSQEVVAAARATGADIPVCLHPRARVMRGAGEVVETPLGMPTLQAVLVNPGVAVPTPAVFKALGLSPGQAVRERRVPASSEAGIQLATLRKEGSSHCPDPDVEELRAITPPKMRDRVDDILASVSAGRNDLEPAAIALAPEIGEALAALRANKGCRLARMSGSGATAFGLYDDRASAAAAARALKEVAPGWWIKATVLR